MTYKNTYSTTVMLFGILFFCLPLFDSVFEVLPKTPFVDKTNTRKHDLFDFKKYNGKLKEFSQQFDNRFGGKSILVNLYNKFKVEILNTSLVPDRVIVGNDEWLFLGNQNNNVALKHTVYSKDIPTYNDNVVKNLKDFQLFCENNDIQFYCMFAPDKHFVYSEYLPTFYQLSLSEKYYTEMYDKIKSNGINFIDLRKPILKLKDKNLLYEKTGTHWNGIGAYPAYNKLIKRIKKDGFKVKPPIPMKNFKLVNKEGPSLELARIIGKKEELKDRRIRLIPIKRFERQDKKFRPPAIYPIDKDKYEFNFKNKNSGNDLTIMFIRDSFLTLNAQLYPYHFKNTSYIWEFSPFFKPEIIKKINPDIIVLIKSERTLSNFGSSDVKINPNLSIKN